MIFTFDEGSPLGETMGSCAGYNNETVQMDANFSINQNKKVEHKQRRLFTEVEGENSRASLGMDEDSNMSNMSTASDSMDGMPTVTTLTKPEEKEG